MKRNFNAAVVVFVSAMLMVLSCKKEATQTAPVTISDAVKAKIFQLGFSTQNLAVHEDGYLVEGDIVIPADQLDVVPSSQFLRIGSSEQYRTTNLVTPQSRAISVSISGQLPSSYVAALDEAIGRYNAQNLSLTFKRVSSGADISIIKGNGNYLASAGFPTSGGDPYNQVKVNARAIGNQPQGTVASILAHEMGHCIGFRHTDYMDRSYSCGGQATNEGASTVGAIQIPGTPSGPDAKSWMLSCIGSGENRPFNGNDIIALTYLY